MKEDKVSTQLPDLYRMAEQQHITIIDLPLPGTTSGLYDEKTRTIILSTGLNSRQKRCTLAHELNHATHHDTGRDPKTEHRACKQTAIQLIDPLDYITAENMYEGNLFAMAAYLDVTQQVLNDYRQIIIDTVWNHS
ncbi:ImmA/IrrE family metallo-endopeptidase [Scardovia wiggsiae]|uniref:ImmA/IrrE family metallo-endopeptidase n=2 Tax=Scardovia wiggsiae TaxID=230143 RepID=UPI00362C3415